MIKILPYKDLLYRSYLLLLRKRYCLLQNSWLILIILKVICFHVDRLFLLSYSEFNKFFLVYRPETKQDAVF